MGARVEPEKAWTILVTCILPLIAVAACGGSSGGQATPAAIQPPPQNTSCPDRGSLCAKVLLEGSSAEWVDNQYFMPASDAETALHAFSGTLNVSPTSLASATAGASGPTVLPGFSVQWITVDDQLVPLERDIIIGGTSNRWSLILSPGNVWSEPGDEGMSRASFPFTLVTERWNEAHNGIATFLYNDTTVSDVLLQVPQETALWNKIDISGRAIATYTPHMVPNASDKEAAFRDELSQRIEVRPWSDLADSSTKFDLTDLSQNVPQADVSAAGVIVDDVLYFREANSRSGAYPYPLEMRHGVFSVTKSSAAALTLLRLAQKYGAQVFDQRVADYVSINVSHSGWNNVTFGHLLSMVAGIGNQAPDPQAPSTFADENDESSDIWQQTWLVQERGDKLQQALRYNNYPWEPGEIVRYNTAHTFVLGEAMDRFYKAMEGPDADVWQMMKGEVYSPIGITTIPTIKTPGAEPLPIYGFGLFLNAYDTARIVQLYQNNGAWNGEQLLNRELTMESLYRNDNAGYTTSVTTPVPGQATQTVHYLNSFWSLSLGDDTCTKRIPYMWGYGGNFVAILPNNTAAFLYADANVHEPGSVAAAAAALRPLCDP